ncbi:ribosomal RNA processing protein 36 homolog [Diprion similis]|uniref:ribosomal RNA processing protein 36 homolog n=1 Tax=Diprion similis TaxID=362088 RepID=UPI001EF88F07|nr:ribosomal RNA processing protein 36 homolog [Diprion similis]
MVSNEEDIVAEEDADRVKIREELSTMSFEDLQKLKQKLGTKVYNEAMFGASRRKKTDFKRENKNRPREMTSKLQVPRFKEIVPVKKKIVRDPRYDSLCGTFNEKAFKNSYKFLNNIVENDVKALKKELEETEDPKMIKKIKYLIQRLENRQREEKRREIKELREAEEKQEKIETLKRGEKPVFKKKSEKRVLELVSQYEELKKSGKLKKHIERLRKKNASKDRKKLAIRDTDL